MANRPKDLGRRWESDVVRAVNERAGAKVCERITQHGSKDQGDLRITVGDLALCVECKRRVKYPGESEMAEFRRQALAEEANADADGVLVVVNRYRQSVLRGEAWMPFRTLDLLRGVRDTTGDVGARWWVCMTLGEFLQLLLPNDGEQGR